MLKIREVVNKLNKEGNLYSEFKRTKGCNSDLDVYHKKVEKLKNWYRKINWEILTRESEPI
jgi:hypothetical protein